jgi:arginyl-tRNA synthetase
MPNWIKEESIKMSEQIFDLIKIKFNLFNGKAFYNYKKQPVFNILEKEKGLLKEEEGAQIVYLGDDIPPAFIKRSDVGSLGLEWDLPAGIWGKEKYNVDKSIFVAGSEQKLNFIQLKAINEKLGLTYVNDIKYVKYGIVLKDDKKMSTPKGNVVKLYYILFQGKAEPHLQYTDV